MQSKTLKFIGIIFLSILMLGFSTYALSTVGVSTSNAQNTYYLTATPTPEFIATTPEPGVEYQLVDWDEERQQELIEFLRQYPETYPYTGNFSIWGELSLHEYPALAQKEAVLHFPDSVYAQEWRFDLAYQTSIYLNAPRYEKLQTTTHLAEIFEEYLNTGNKITSLEAWFEIEENTLRMHLLATTPPPTYDQAFIVFVSPAEDIETGSYMGGGYIYVIRSEGKYQVGPVFQDFVYHAEGGISHELVDISGDGVEELVIHHGYWASGNGPVTFIRIFDFSEGYPLPFSFFPYGKYPVTTRLGFGYDWETYHEDDNDGIIVMDEGGHGCYNYEMNYAWNGEWMELVDTVYSDSDIALERSEPYDIQKLYDDLPYSTHMLEVIIEEYPKLWVRDDSLTEQDESLTSDAKESALLRLGMDAIMRGEEEQGRAYLTQILEEGYSAMKVEQFLASYQQRADLYQALRSAGLDSFLPDAIRTLIQEMPEESDTLAFLQARGVQLWHSGQYDFEGDGQPEDWFIHRNPGNREFEFWLLLDSPLGMQAVYVDELSSGYVGIQVDQESTETPIIINQEIQFQIQRSPLTDKVYIFPLNKLDDAYVFPITLGSIYEDNYEKFQQIRDDLLAGESPQEILIAFKILSEEENFYCRYGDSLFFDYANSFCDEYKYYLALAYELSGDETRAVALYLDVWQTECCTKYPILTNEGYDYLVYSNPFAMMAKAKLEIAP